MSSWNWAGYRVVEGWERLPEGYRHLDGVGVATDAQDRVYFITRSDSRVIVFERDGSFVTSWGEGVFTPRTHCIRFGPDGSIYTADDGDHTVRKFTPDGKQLMMIGTPGAPSDTGHDPTLVELYDRMRSIKRGGPPFNKPTAVAIAENGDLYVTDGYGNARVHHFSSSGELIRSWGEPGTQPGQFNLPHDVCIHPDGRLLVADRENERIQVFDLDGEFVEQWTDLQRPAGLAVDSEGYIYVAENAWRAGERTFRRGIVPEIVQGHVSILDPKGRRVALLGLPDGEGPATFWAPHGICVDSRGDIYLAEVVASHWGKAGGIPAGSHSLQKLERLR